VVVADDERPARSFLLSLLRSYDDVVVVGEAGSGDEAVRLIERERPDLALLDLQMPELDGLDVVRTVARDLLPLVAFVTAYDEYAVQAFELNAVDYLLKPVEPDRLKKALDKARQRETKERFSDAVKKHQAIARLPVQTRQGLVLLDPRAVTHAVLEGELVTVHTKDASFLTDYTLNDLEQRLSGGSFERVHRRALLNLEAVTRLEPLETGGYLARTVNGGSVEVSRQAARDLRKRLGLRKGPDDEG